MQWMCGSIQTARLHVAAILRHPTEAGVSSPAWLNNMVTQQVA